MTGNELLVFATLMDGNTGRHHCRGSQVGHVGARCISFGGMRVDQAIGAEFFLECSATPRCRSRQSSGPQQQSVRLLVPGDGAVMRQIRMWD